MRRSFVVALLLLAMITVISGCGKEDAVVKIGYIGPLAGDGAPWGIAESNTIKMMVDDLNESGGLLGKKVELVVYDNRMDPVETTNAARKMIEQDKVVAIIGCNSSSAAIALAGVCEQYKVPHIATTATNPLVTVESDGTVKPFSFRVQYTDPYQGSCMAGFAYDELGARRAAILFEISSDYSVGLADYFEETFKAKGGEIVAREAYKTGDVEFRSQLTKIRESNPEVLFVPALYKEIALITNQARALGLNQPFLGGDSWSNLDIFNMANEAVDGSAYFVSPIHKDDPKLDDFKRKYEEKHGVTPGGEGANCYFAHDAFTVLVDAIKRADELDPVAIRDAIEETKDVEGIVTTFTIEKETHNPHSPEAWILQLKGGTHVPVKKYSPTES
jgi:branched-chain amino acid transport system substrate-binding protein